MSVYRFQVSYPVHSLLPRDYFTNTFHMDHVGGVAVPTDLDGMCDDINELWQTRLGATGREVRTKAYAVPHTVPSPPLADRVLSAGVIWTPLSNCEPALCLSFAGNASSPRERGRMYFSTGMARTTGVGTTHDVRPTTAQQDWVLAWYDTSGSSLPDLGGVDWKFGVWSPTNSSFVQAQKAWVDDEWDVVRSRGLRESTRRTSVREG